MRRGERKWKTPSESEKRSRRVSVTVTHRLVFFLGLVVVRVRFDLNRGEDGSLRKQCEMCVLGFKWASSMVDFDGEGVSDSEGNTLCVFSVFTVIHTPLGAPTTAPPSKLCGLMASHSLEPTVWNGITCANNVPLCILYLWYIEFIKINK